MCDRHNLPDLLPDADCIVSNRINRREVPLSTESPLLDAETEQAFKGLRNALLIVIIIAVSACLIWQSIPAKADTLPLGVAWNI